MKKSTLRELRELKGIPQNKMFLNVNRSQYSRIETGTTDLKMNVLNTICDRFGITLEEYISLDGSNNKIEQLVIEFRACTRHVDNIVLKENFLDKFMPLCSKERPELTRIELNFTLSVRSILSTYWKEIPEIMPQELEDLLEYLTSENFYGQYDYMVALNTLKHFDTMQIEKILTAMSPLKLSTRRNELTKHYYHLFITNAITAFIYAQEYNTALKYVEKAQESIELKDSYYLHLNLLYLKNLSLSFIENHTKYIEKTRNVIRIIHDIGDITNAKQLEDELDILNRCPDYFKKTKRVIEQTAGI